MEECQLAIETIFQHPFSTLTSRLFFADRERLSFKDGSPDRYVFQLSWVNGVRILFEYREVRDFARRDTSKLVLFSP